MPATNYQSVDEYIAAQPPATHPVLRRVRTIIRKALPDATEGISYQVPVYKVGGRMALYFAGFKQHYSIYPATAKLMSALGPQARQLLHSKATLRFSYDEPVPTHLISRIAKLRAAEAGQRVIPAGKTRKTAAKKAKKAAR